MIHTQLTKPCGVVDIQAKASISGSRIGVLWSLTFGMRQLASDAHGRINLNATVSMGRLAESEREKAKENQRKSK
jgi:hypothetical protein